MKTPNKPKYRVKKGTARQTPTVQVAEQQRIRIQAPKSPVFTAPVSQALTEWNQSTDQLGQLAADLKAAQVAIKELLGKVHTATEQYRIDERKFIGAVELVAGGNPDAIRSLGYAAVGGPSPKLGPLEPPATLVGKPGTDPGSVHLSWKAVHGAASYALQASAEPVTDGSWKPLEGKTGTRRKVGDLVPGARCWFRVASVGASGQTRFGDPVVVTAR